MGGSEGEPSAFPSSKEGSHPFASIVSCGCSAFRIPAVGNSSGETSIDQSQKWKTK